MLIAISGVATAGKNLFSTLLIKRLAERYPNYICREFSLAFNLRKELAPILKKNFNLDAWSKDSNEKNKFRDLFTVWADMRRRETNGRYFYEKLWQEVSKFEKKETNINIVTDVRFKEYEYDEVDFFKEKGVVVHVSKFTLGKNGRKNFTLPANRFEQFNDPRVKKMADYKVAWPNLTKSFYQNDLMIYIDKFIDYLDKRDLITDELR